MLAKLENDTLILAPSKLHYTEDDKEIFIANPTKEQLIALGYMEVVEQEQPTCNENEQAIVSYEIIGDTIIQRWNKVEIELVQELRELEK